MPTKVQKPLTPDLVLDKMAKYCAYQERCVKEVTDKLKTFEISAKDQEDILNYLIDNRFVDNERFAKAFVRGKINQSGWGLNKIRYHLMQKGIDKELIDATLEDFDQEVYRQRLIEVLQTKSKTVKAPNEFEKNRKLAAYAIQKGFEPSLVWEVIKNGEVLNVVNLRS